MYELPTSDSLFTNFIQVPVFLPISTTGSQANPSSQGYTVTPTEGSGIDWSIPPHVKGPDATSEKYKFTTSAQLTPPPGNVHESYYAYNTSHDVPPLQAAIPDFPASPVPTCGLAGGLPCALPLEGSVTSIKRHLRMHGHRHPQRLVVQCPFMGCSDTLQWINIPRHIRSIHLGVRFRCPNCDKLYTRAYGLTIHTALLKCYSQCLFCIERKHTRHLLQAPHRWNSRR